MNDTEQIFMDDYFSDHSPLSRKAAEKRLKALLDEARREGKITILKQLERMQPPATWSEDYHPLFNQGFNTMRSKVSFMRQRLEKLTQKQEN